MNLEQSVRTCLAKYADFSGTASRSEFWYFVLAYFLLGLGLSVLGAIVSFSWVLFLLVSLVNLVVSLGLLIPWVAVATRRLHDTGRSGWWQLVGFVPFVGIIVLIVFLAQESKPSEFA